MDILAHTLMGAALARAGFQRITPHATLLLILSATIPDIDSLARLGGPLADIKLRLGYTHTLVALPILALVCVGLTAAIRAERIPVAKAWIIACIGVAGHLLLDWTGSYGIRLLLPFSPQWFYLDLNAADDGVILVVLALALVWPWFVNLISSEIGASAKYKGQGSAIAALLLLLLYQSGRWSLHERALTDLNSRLYNGEVPIAVAALPEALNPLAWTGVVETQNAFRVVKTGSLDIGDASDSRVLTKPEETVAYRAALRTEPFRYMAYFARFPVWGLEPVDVGPETGERLDLTDLRFGLPGAGEFHAIAITDKAGRVLSSKFSFSMPERIR